MKGQLTFIAEGNNNPESHLYSRKLRTDDRGGLVIGKSYRFYEKTENQIINDMHMIGLNSRNINVLCKYSQLRGYEARIIAEKYGRYIQLTQEQELNLFDKEYDLCTEEVKTFITNNMQAYGVKKFEDLHEYQKEILIDIYHARHFDLRIQDLLLTTLGKCEKDRSLYLFNDLIRDSNLWKQLGVPLDRIKYRIIHLKNSISSQKKSSDKIYGVPRGLISELFVKKPEDYLITGLHLDNAGGEFLLILKYNFGLRDSGWKKMLEGVDLNDLILCLQIFYDKTIKHKFIGASHILDPNNPADSPQAFGRVLYPDVYEKRDILKGTRIAHDLLELIDTVHDLAEDPYSVPDFTGEINSEAQEILEELQTVGFEMLHKQAGNNPIRNLRTSSSDKNQEDMDRILQKQTSLNQIKQKNDIILLRSLAKKTSKKISQSPFRSLQQSPDSINSTQRAISVQKNRNLKLSSISPDFMNTDRPGTSFSNSLQINLNSLKNNLNNNSPISSMARTNSMSLFNGGKEFTSDTVFENSPVKINPIFGNHFIQLPHNTIHVSPLDSDEITWMEKVNRIWVKPSNVNVVDCELDQRSEYLFIKEVQMKLEAGQVRKLDPLALDDIAIQSTSNPTVKYAAKFTKLADKLRKYSRCLQRFEQIVKAWTLAQRIYNKRIPVDLNRLESLVERQHTRGYCETVERDNQLSEDGKLLMSARSMSNGKGDRVAKRGNLSDRRGYEESGVSKSRIRVTVNDSKIRAGQRRKKQSSGLEAHLVGVMIDFGDEILKKSIKRNIEHKELERGFGIAQSIMNDQMFEEKRHLQKEVELLEKGTFQIEFPLLRKESCVVCQKLLNFLETCTPVERDYYCGMHHPFSCQKCFGLIRKEGRVQVGNKFYHQDCMICSRCGKPLNTNKSYKAEDHLVHIKCSDPLLFSLGKTNRLEHLFQEDKILSRKFGNIKTLKKEYRNSNL